MSEHIEIFKEWLDSLREDVEAIKVVLESEAVDIHARTYAASALNYLVARMDLVPDWNHTIGVLDDVFVLRVCMERASAYNMDEGIEDTDVMVRLARMGNEVGTIEEFLGEDLYLKLRKYCSRLGDDEVRSRTSKSIVEDAEIRKTLYGDVADELARIPAARFKDPDAMMVHFKSYLHHKLD